MLRKTILIYISLFLYFHSSAQNQVRDSVENLVKSHTTEDSIRVGLLIDLAHLYTTSDNNKSLPLIEEAIQVSKRIGFDKGEGISLNALSTYYTINGDLGEALKSALRSQAIFKAIHDEQNLIVSNSTLARIYEANTKYEKALEIQLSNIELIKNEPPSPKKASFYFYAGKSAQELKRYPDAAKHFQAALEISKQAHFPMGIAIAEGSLGILYGQLGNHNKAIAYLNRTLEFSKSQSQYTTMAATYESLANSYFAMKKYDRAIENNSKAIKIYEEQNNYRRLKDVYEDQYGYHEAIDDHKMANRFLKLHYSIVDSILSMEKVRVIEELQTKYETEKKETEIASLSQQSAIQSLQIQQKNQTMIIGLVIVLLVLSAIYFLYRQRSLKNQQAQTELEQRFLRSQLNPHFISNALLAVQNFMLKNQADKAALYLAKFSKLMREILENSRQEFILVEDEVEMLKNYMDIHKLRMNDAFDYKVMLDDNIDPETDTIPPMFVQPFVENAIEHGIVNAKNGGLIELNFVKSGDYISIEIKDNGEGLSKSQAAENHTSLSTTIIKERMELFNKSLKNKIQLLLGDYSNDQGEILGTKVELKVPFGYI